MAGMTRTVTRRSANFVLAAPLLVGGLLMDHGCWKDDQAHNEGIVEGSVSPNFNTPIPFLPW